MDHTCLMHVIHSLKQHLKDGRITFGGQTPPSCEETNLLSEQYDPQVECTCEDIEPATRLQNKCNSGQHECRAIRSMKEVMEKVIERKDEWHNTGLFTPAKLRLAVDELVNSNTNIQESPKICLGTDILSSIPRIQAPDRRPNPSVDTNPRIGNQLYPTAEQLKICTDAKYFGVISCGGSLCDEGLARAVADSCNDILIGDYCEAADAKGLKLLQQVGAAAMSFLKLCNMAGRVTDWQFNNLYAYIVQCRVLGYYRDHTRSHLPDGIYGSRMTGLGVHRHIDVAAFHGVMTASLGTGQEVTEEQFSRIVEATVYISDFVDLRGDTMRKQRENVILRGIRGDLCKYLDETIGNCLDLVADVIESSELGALVVMGYCNWAIMSAHHKVYELLRGIQQVQKQSACEYVSVSQATRYERLIEALRPYGTLGNDGPRVSKKRIEMDKSYALCQGSSEKHLAWLADATRSLLEPTTLRQVLDVVHFEWSGDVGAVDYCP
ncbi:uncharacterized protein N7479_001290 [Penicillium vulpinum]|nr:uncharacterized protein N7479_001290 [Penicillium vulpinum]KAJ5971372.1 hypothetical protein N7479_001290 [Penicillium vulpinum]